MLRRLDRVRQAFYRRCKSREQPGYPRFRSSRRWKTIEIEQPTASMVTNRRGKWVVKVKGLPILVIKPRRELPDPRSLKTLSITRKPTGVYVSLGYEVEKEALPKVGQSVCLDMGVRSRTALSPIADTPKTTRWRHFRGVLPGAGAVRAISANYTGNLRVCDTETPCGTATSATG